MTDDRYPYPYPGDGWPPPGPHPQGATSPPYRTWRARAASALRGGALAAGVVVLVTKLFICSLNLWTPTTSRFMWASDVPVIHEHVDVDHVSRNVLAAFIYHEDRDFPTRPRAFEWDEFRTRVERHLAGEKDKSGSTIHQQVVKNLLLTPEMSWKRKGVEALLAVDLASTVERRQILQIYVNMAQLGPGIYGICAASWYYYGRPPHDLEESQAIELAGLLPSPDHVGRRPGGGIERIADGNPWSAYTIANAEKRLPYAFERYGFEPVTQLGIEGYAEPEPGAPDSCQSMPDAVAARIEQEGTG